MIDATKEQVAKAVQDNLREIPGAKQVRVLVDEVRKDQSESGWWYVPVSIHRDTENMGLIYTALSEVEETLLEHEGLSVLLVPRIIPFQKWSDVA
jgi:hypothetical protein